jgi:hypothetical protein
MVTIDTGKIPPPPMSSGFEEPLVDTCAGRIRFRARRPQAQIPR